VSVAAGRRHQQVPDRAVARLARDRVPGDDPDGERQEQGDRGRERGDRHEQPVVRDVAEERRTAVVAAGRHPDGDRDEDRHQGERAEHRPGPAAAEDERELGAEQREGATAAGERAGDGSVRLRHRSPPR
jgi:hypothetical protein